MDTRARLSVLAASLVWLAVGCASRPATCTIERSAHLRTNLSSQETDVVLRDAETWLRSDHPNRSRVEITLRRLVFTSVQVDREALSITACGVRRDPFPFGERWEISIWGVRDGEKWRLDGWEVATDGVDGGPLSCSTR